MPFAIASVLAPTIVADCASLASAELPALQQVGKHVHIGNLPRLHTLALPVLDRVGAFAEFYRLTALEQLALPALQHVRGTLHVAFCFRLARLELHPQLDIARHPDFAYQLDLRSLGRLTGSAPPQTEDHCVEGESAPGRLNCALESPPSQTTLLCQARRAHTRYSRAANGIDSEEDVGGEAAAEPMVDLAVLGLSQAAAADPPWQTICSD